MEIDELVEQVKDAATEVYAALGEGHTEDVYEHAMEVEFQQRGVSSQMNAHIDILYKSKRVGTTVLDFIVEGRLVVELTAQDNLDRANVAQARAYMREAGIDAGLLINFPYPAQLEPQFEVLR